MSQMCRLSSVGGCKRNGPSKSSCLTVGNRRSRKKAHFFSAGSGLVLSASANVRAVSDLRVAAIVPVYNRSTVVLDALNSIAAQTFALSCLIVVDDGSTDSTAEVVQHWFDSKKLSYETRLIRQSNAGPAAARNRGVAESGATDLLAFLDSDDLWPMDFLQRTQQAMTTDPGAVAVSCDMLNTDNHGWRELQSASDFQGSATAQLLKGNPPGMPATMVRTKAFQRIGGFDSNLRFAEDYHFLLRLSLLGSWLYAPGAPLKRRMQCNDGEPAQSKKFDDRALIRAQMIDRFIHQDGGASAVDENLWRPRLAHLWHRAGRSLLKLQRRSEASDCFNRAVALNPLHLRARWRAMTA